MSYTTRTKELGKITFTAPAAGSDYLGHVWVESWGSGVTSQICHGGEFKGLTLTTTADGLKDVAQRWIRARARRLRK